MITMKKTAIAAALAMSMGATAAQAFPIYNFAYNGTFTMLDGMGNFVGQDPALTGTMSMDMGTGTGTAAINPSQDFMGAWWTAHNITLQAIGPGTVQANMLFDYGVTTNIPVTVDFSMTPIGPGTFSIATLDGNGDGIPGYPMTTDPFPGFNATFGGTATVTSVISGVPVPAAAWLLGSGLLGLVGVARRKYA